MKERLIAFHDYFFSIEHPHRTKNHRDALAGFRDDRDAAQQGN